jgi:hypothetical protein
MIALLAVHNIHVIANQPRGDYRLAARRLPGRRSG